MTKDSFGWTNWTGLRKNDPQSLAAEIEKIKKWQRTHSGIDFSAAGPDYPHPNQKVRVLQFFEGNGRLDPSGIQFKDNDPSYGAGNNPGIFWVSEFTDDPFNESSGALYGDLGVNDVELKLQANITDYLAAINLYGGTAGGYSSVTLTAFDTSTVTQVILYAGHPTIGDAFRVINAALMLDGQTADFSPVSDGSLWYRSDTDKFRARINGTTENLATESYVASAATNHVPYAAKTATYTTTANDGVISVDATSASFTVTLVTAVGNAGLTQTFKKTTAANVVTIDANGSQTIDGALTYALSAQWSWVTLVSTGSAWLITGAG